MTFYGAPTIASDSVNNYNYTIMPTENWIAWQAKLKLRIAVQQSYLPCSSILMCCYTTWVHGW